MTRAQTSTELVANALSKEGIDVALIRMMPDSTRTAAEAAAAVGVEVGAIANSLIFVADEEPLLVMTSGAHRVHERRLARRIGVSKITRATPDFVKASTGQVIGGVSPVGHPLQIRTIVDSALQQFDEIWAAAGSAHAVFPTTFDALVAMTQGEVSDVD